MVVESDILDLGVWKTAAREDELVEVDEELMLLTCAAERSFYHLLNCILIWCLFLGYIFQTDVEQLDERIEKVLCNLHLFLIGFGDEVDEWDKAVTQTVAFFVF